MDFFDSFPPPPPPPRPVPTPPPVWARPETTVPGSAPAELLLIRTDDAAVWVGGLLAYPNGFSFSMRAVRRLLPDGTVRMPRPATSRPELDADPFRAARPHGGLRIGLQYADGRRAAAGQGVAARLAAHRDPDARTLRLMEGSGGGTDHTWDADFWVSPLPPEGPVTFVAAWPEAGAAESRAELDAAVILAAASRAVDVWPEGGGTS